MRTLIIALITAVFAAGISVELSHRLLANQAMSLYVAIAVTTFLVVLLNVRLARGSAPGDARSASESDSRGARSRQRETRSTRGTDATDRESGTVKWFNRQKGFGFIVRESGEEIFIHHRSIRSDGSDRRANLRDGQAVTFSVAQHNKGLQAEDVVPEGRS